MAPRSKRTLAGTLDVSAKRAKPLSTRSSGRKQEASRTNHGHSTLFKAIWRELRTERWYSKPPHRATLMTRFTAIFAKDYLEGSGRHRFCCW
ncbi:hypothetical protein JG688_00010730 [Phytophthora aleatoria]|uniref:Uncharacterized protein n=1 Tax=Phytophthora aleatoria TaxID=2496075 RepID=A0A8J5IE82_9STRA|nr:hypothetical protein JG688_00010730 [Phytophthora aleatoria]